MSFKLWQITLVYILSTQLILASGIATDGTMGAAQTLSGSNISIPQVLGTTVGHNLFHSFADFNINSGQTVTFTGGTDLQNVISRVTGSNPSIIDGKLISNIPNADFYFINPNGITFGANAQVDVPAAFHVSTADKIDLGANGGVFYADTSNVSQLSSEIPTAFGFLGTSIATNGLLDINGAQLAIKNGQTLDAVVGQITIENNATITAPAGNIRLVAMQGMGSVSLEKTGDGILPLPTITPTALNAGNITISSSTIDTSGDSGGSINFWGDNMSLMTSQLLSNNSGATDASSNKGINIKAWSLTDTASSISADSNDSGSAGTVSVTAKTLAMDNGGYISSNSNSSGAGGEVSVSATNLTINNAAYISSDATDTGSAGTVSVTAKTLAMDNGGYISSDSMGSGAGGDVSVSADNLTLSNSAYISSDALGPSSSAGTVSVTTKTLAMDKSGYITSDSMGSGAGGDVSVSADNLSINNAAYISSDANGSGVAGTVSVTANTLAIDNNAYISSDTNGSGAGGEVSVSATNLTLSNSAYISADANVGSTNNAGIVMVDAKNIALLSGGEISSSTYSAGNAGLVLVTSDKLTIDGANGNDFTGILSLARKDSMGDGGNVEVNAGNISIQNAGAISSTSNANGYAGNVSVVADTITLANGGNISSDALESSSGKVGDISVVAGNSLAINNNGSISSINDSLANISAGDVIGNISVSAPNIVINNSTISSASTGNFAAATIDVHFTNSLCMTNSFINTSANTGNGGSIAVTGGELIYLTDSGFITSVSGAAGNGGDITSSASMLVMNSGLIQANAVSGNGGNINLKFDALIPSSNTLALGGKPVIWKSDASVMNVIQAASQSGVSGAINNTAPQLSLSGVLATMSNSNFDSHLVSQDFCALGNGSSLTKKGKGGLPLRAKDMLIY